MNNWKMKELISLIDCLEVYKKNLGERERWVWSNNKKGKSTTKSTYMRWKTQQILIFLIRALGFWGFLQNKFFFHIKHLI